MDLPSRSVADAEEAGSGEHAVEPPRTDPVRVNWLFAGVLLGAGSWLLVLSVIFAALGEWDVAAALFVGMCLCLLGVWRAGRRAARERAAGAALLE